MGLAKSQQSLKNWTAQKWRTSDGKPSKGKKRYLPDAAWKSLSPSEKASTNAAKAKGNAKGEQFVAQPKKIKEKTKSFRELGGIINKLDDMKMKMEYKKGGKKSIAKEAKRERESFMQESKELKFGAPSKKFKNGGPNKLEKPTADSTEIFKNRRDNAVSRFEQVQNYPSSDKRGDERKKSNLLDEIQQSYTDLERQKLKGRAGYDKNGNPKPEPKGIYPNQKDAAEEALKFKKGGKKTMEPGGGGRFAKMVNKMKGEGKSEESAKAIAASIGRKKYGKSKFQEMAAAGKKKMGGKKC